MERYPRQMMPTRTNTPTMNSSLVFSIGRSFVSAGCVVQPDRTTDRNKLVNLRVRRLDELRRRRHQGNFALPQHRHPIANGEDLRDLMADHNGGELEPALHRHDQNM